MNERDNFPNLSDNEHVCLPSGQEPKSSGFDSKEEDGYFGLVIPDNFSMILSMVLKLGNTVR